MIDVVLIDSDLETVKYGVQADTLLYCQVSFGLEPGQKIIFSMIMESVNDLIGKPDKAVNIIDRRPQVSMQHPDSTAERCTISLSSYFTAFLADIVKQAYHSLVFVVPLP